MASRLCLGKQQTLLSLKLYHHHQCQIEYHHFKVPSQEAQEQFLFCFQAPFSHHEHQEEAVKCHIFAFADPSVSSWALTSRLLSTLSLRFAVQMSRHCFGLNLASKCLCSFRFYPHKILSRFHSNFLQMFPGISQIHLR